MKTGTAIMCAALAAAVLCTVAVVAGKKRQQSARQESGLKVETAQPYRESAPPPRAESAPNPAEGGASGTVAQPGSPTAETSVKTQAIVTARAAAPSKQSGPQQSQNATDKGDKDPLARVALSFVGADPEAEAYWVGAINDPGLSANERQNLIEDLNEDGLSDPKHPSPADLPVILRRLALIEALAPYAMDQVNADAFQEAYKDLVNLADLAAGGGTPVR